MEKKLIHIILLWRHQHQIFQVLVIHNNQLKLHLEKETLEELFFNSWIANANPTITCVNSSSSLL